LQCCFNTFLAVSFMHATVSLLCYVGPLHGHAVSLLCYVISLLAYAVPLLTFVFHYFLIQFNGIEMLFNFCVILVRCSSMKQNCCHGKATA